MRSIEVEDGSINGKAFTNGMTKGPSAVRLLRAASVIAGGEEALARRLDIRAGLLTKFMSGRYELPPQLLLQAVDIILEEREARQSPQGSPAASSMPNADA